MVLRIRIQGSIFQVGSLDRERGIEIGWQNKSLLYGVKWARGWLAERLKRFHVVLRAAAEGYCITVDKVTSHCKH